MSLFRTPSARFGNLIDSGDTRKRAVDIPLYSGWSNVTNVKKMLRIALLIGWKCWSTSTRLARMSYCFNAIGCAVQHCLTFPKYCRTILCQVALRSQSPLEAWVQIPLLTNLSFGCGQQLQSSSPLARCPLQGNLFANVFFFVNIKGSRKLAFPLTENLILNVSMTLTLRKPDKDTDTCCMNMRGMLLLHSFSVSPAWTLNFDCTVYQRMA